jgi:D-glycero-alpha-D-manno-heptose-7-phosphate kinase
VASSYASNLDDRRRELRIIQDLVDEGMSILASDSDITNFGRLLDEGWLAKRTLGVGVSNSSVDAIYADAREAGAIGGKLLGAGGGGFILLFVPPDRHETVKERLDGLIHVPFSFERFGSQIIFYESDTDYTEAEKARMLHPKQAFRELT